MKPIDAYYERLTSFAGTDADQILGAALEFAEPGWFERIEAILAMRPGDVAPAALFGCYARLSPNVKAQLENEQDKLCGRLAQTMRLSSPGMRESALTLIQERRLTSLAYLLAPALRDSVARNRTAAARALLILAEQIRAHDELRTPETMLDTAAQEEHKRLVLAIREALRSFERYPQVEILRTACWFARDLGSSLWRMLEQHNGKAGGIVFRLMDDWDEPAMAFFLLRALGSQWRGETAKRLAKWATPAHLTALLAAVDAIEGDAVREGLRGLRKVAWFEQVDEKLSQIAPHLRANAPALLAATGLPAAVKNRLVEGLSHEIGGPDAVAAFLAENPPQADVEKAAEVSDWQAAGDADSQRVFEQLWACCRRLPAARRSELIELLRSEAGLFAAGLHEKLTTGDPRDRVLGLQIIGTRELGLRFLEDMEKLRGDTVDAIRALASGAVEELRRQAASSSAATTPETDSREIAGMEPEMARQRLDEILAELAADPTRGASVELVAELRSALLCNMRPQQAQVVGAWHDG